MFLIIVPVIVLMFANSEILKITRLKKIEFNYFSNKFQKHMLRLNLLLSRFFSNVDTFIHHKFV